MARCKLCGKYFKIITNTHLNSVHRCTLKEYSKKFGIKNCGFISPNLLPKSDPRYKKWKESLKKRPPTWCNGYTKETHPSVLKISRTFKKKKIDNFAGWRQQMKKLRRKNYPDLPKDGNTAELIGVILGDGHIGKFPRTESLTIYSNTNNIGFIQRYTNLLERLFKKKPYVALSQKGTNCTRIRIYQKNISKRLNIPIGSRKNQNIKIPQWISRNKRYLKRYIRGLYEAEGCFCIHKPTYTYKFMFSNRNRSLLENVYYSLKILGFHPHRSKYIIQISRKEEVYKAKNLLKFRQY